MQARPTAAVIGITALFFVAAPAASGADLEAGKVLYGKWCQACHGPTGQGNPAMEKVLKKKVQDLGAIDFSKLSPAERQAREQELRKAIADGKPPMTGFAKKLSKEEQENVLRYVETTFMRGGQ